MCYCVFFIFVHAASVHIKLMTYDNNKEFGLHLCIALDAVGVALPG